jgi:hypothetical protein
LELTDTAARMRRRFARRKPSDVVLPMAALSDKMLYKNQKRPSILLVEKTKTREETTAWQRPR